MLLRLLPIVIIVFANLSLALFVYLRNEKSWVHRSFAIFAGTLSLWTISISQLFTQQTMLWSDATLLFGNVIGVGSFILFAKHFPEHDLIQKKSLISFFFVPIVLFLTLSPFRPFIAGMTIIEGQLSPVIGPLYPILMLWSIFGSLYGIIIIFRKFIKSRGLPRAQLKYLLSGFIIFLFVVTLTGVILPTVGVASLGFYSPAASLVLVGIISYSMVKHRLMDINFLVARSVAYIFVVMTFASIYGGLLFAGGQLLVIESVSRNVLIVAIVLALVLAISFQPLARKIASLTDRVFYKGFYDPSKLLYDTSVILASTLYLEDIIHDTLEKILLEMKIQDGSFVLTEEGKIYQVAAEGKDQDGLTYDESELQLLLTEKNVFDINAVSDRRIKSLLKKLGVEVVVTLFQEGKHLGWCFLGPKLSGEMYSTKDFRVLEILAPQIAVAIQNAKSYEEIRRFNITLEKEVDQATKRLVIANNKLQELDKLKDEFVSVASHELRTPMTAIKSYLWMALQGKGGDLTTKQKYYLERAYSSTDRLIKLVNEMLNISRIESGRIALQVSKVELFDLLKEVIAEVLPRAQELELTISLKRSVQGDHGDGQRSIQVLADVDKCKEVLINLIGNSLKFTPKGGKITLEVSQDSATEVSVHVHDTGVGIAPEYVPSLFQKFGLIEGSYQTNQAASQGTGLGLFISKSIVELHGGKIWMESAGVGKGATFSFTLPIYSAAREKMFRKKFDETTDAGIIRNIL